MDCLGCFDPSNAIIRAPGRFPRAAHNVPRYPRPSLATLTYEGYHNDLDFTQQFVDPVLGMPGIVETKSTVDLHVGALAGRYIGEQIDGREAHHRNCTGRGGKIVWARNTYETEGQGDVFIDGEFGGSMTSSINHHCDPNVVSVKLTKSDNGKYGLDFIVIKEIPAGGDLFFNNRSQIGVGIVPLEHLKPCYCKGYDAITHLPICTKMML